MQLRPPGVLKTGMTIVEQRQERHQPQGKLLAVATSLTDKVSQPVMFTGKILRRDTRILPVSKVHFDQPGDLSKYGESFFSATDE